jgi:hypothetical protein
VQHAGVMCGRRRAPQQVRPHLEVSVDDALGVDVSQPRQNLAQDGPSPVLIQLSSVEHVAQRARTVLHLGKGGRMQWLRGGGRACGEGCA